MHYHTCTYVDICIVCICVYFSNSYPGDVVYQQCLNITELLLRPEIYIVVLSLSVLFCVPLWQYLFVCQCKYIRVIYIRTEDHVRQA